MEEAINDMIGEGGPGEAGPLPSPDEPIRCIVYGYMKDGRRSFGRMLLAAKVRGELKHVAVIEVNDLPQQSRQALAARLPSIPSAQPLVKSPFAGSWVEPTLSCDISFEDWAGDDTLQAPKFEKW